MNHRNHLIRLASLAAAMLIVLACGVSLDWGDSEPDKSPAEQTLEAVLLQQTVEALSGQVESAQAQDPAAEAAITVTHEMVPGNPGSPDQEKDEIDTENTASSRTALGDSFRLGNFERPFTEGDMVYHPELDIVKLLLSEGTDFYYFTFEMSGPGQSGFSNAYYGVEFDTDYDGRGDYLLWAKGTDSKEWVIDGVKLLEDVNGNVGGSSPVVPDTNDGDGYERVLFGPDALDDPDIAWVRVDPSDGSNVQLAIKKAVIDKNRWYWKAWADAGVADPAQFDYNDKYSEAQAGSPNKSTGLYPIAALNLMDSTCWIAYNLTPTGTELGGCVQIQPTQPPKATDEPGCDCSNPFPSSYGADCCAACGHYWSGSVCYDPPD